MVSINDKAVDAVGAILEMTDIVEISNYIAGDKRATIIEAAKNRIEDLTRPPKQGEIKKITQSTSDFKDGVQRTKGAVTCEDVIKGLRDRGRKI